MKIHFKPLESDNPTTSLYMVNIRNSKAKNPDIPYSAKVPV